MANLNEKEISLMKAASCKLDNDTIFILSYLVHTEKGSHGKKSDYFYHGRIEKIADIENEIKTMRTDENLLKPWKFKGLPEYDSVVYDKNSDNKQGAKWLVQKIKKACNFEEFSKILNGWKKTKKVYNDNAKYPVDDYILDDGKTVIKNLLEAKNTLLQHVGHTLIHKCILKKA